MGLASKTRVGLEVGGTVELHMIYIFISNVHLKTITITTYTAEALMSLQQCLKHKRKTKFIKMNMSNQGEKSPNRAVHRLALLNFAQHFVIYFEDNFCRM